MGSSESKPKESPPELIQVFQALADGNEPTFIKHMELNPKLAMFPYVETPEQYTPLHYIFALDKNARERRTEMGEEKFQERQ